MDSRNFPTIETKYLRGETVGTDVGFIPPASGFRNPGPTPNLRGVEVNTARSKGTPMGAMQDVIKLEHATATDAPHSDPFKVHGEY